MKSKPVSVWLPFGFSATLSVIALIGMIAGQFMGDSLAPGLIPLIAFLPMPFYFAAASHRATRDYIDALEARVRELESDQQAA